MMKNRLLIGKKGTLLIAVLLSLLQTEMLVQGDWVELERSEVKLDDMLGEGAFGEVYRGEVQIDGEKRPCAVKKVKGKIVFIALLVS